MSMNRVVITGMGAVSPYGKGVKTLMDSLMLGKSAVQAIPEMKDIGGLRSRVAGIVPEVDPKEIDRKYRRSMSRMSIYAAIAAKEALAQGRVPDTLCSDGKMGVAIGSTIGSIRAMENFFRDYFSDSSLERMRSTFFFQTMNHSCAANVSHMLGIAGRTLAPAAACATGCQAIGIGFEMIASGKQNLMLCGGSDEFHPLFTGTFDVMNAASIKYNESPSQTPRPFDRDRDGVVCSEGCGLLLLESLASAKNRKVEIGAEIIGFASVSDPSSIANPDAMSIRNCMEKAVLNAGLKSDEIDYINAHATATLEGDVAECMAINAVFGDQPPVSSLKGHMGHTMAASGSLELIAVIGMIQKGWIIPTLNLDNVDPMCNNINHIRLLKNRPITTIIKNSFALGGINSSIVLRRYEDE